MEVLAPKTFFVLQKNFSRIPFTQSEGWYKYLKAKGENIVFLMDEAKDPNIACWGREHQIPFINKKILQIEGECYNTDLSEKVFKGFFADLGNLPYEGIEINSNNIYLIDFEIGIRRAGFLRPLSFHSCPLTIEIDLDSDFNFDRNWRRNLIKAHENQLSFSEVKQTDIVLTESIVRNFREMAESKKLKYKLARESLSVLLASSDIRTFIVKNLNDEIIAARILHEHNNVLSDVFAANSNEARGCGATYFLMNSILNLLKLEGKIKFDYGRIPPSNHATDSVYIFKNASRGRRVQYNGEWVNYKNKWVENLMFFYKHLIINKQRY
jgi:hypothetical protein